MPLVTDFAARADVPASLVWPSRYPAFGDRLVLTIIFLIPLLPRPTIESSWRSAAPAALTVMILAILLLPSRGSLSRRSLVVHRATGFVAFTLGLVVVLYASRIYIRGDSAEVRFFLGRSLAWLTSILVFHWIWARKISLVAVLRALFWGVVVLSAITVVVGFTGIALFGEIHRPRTFGILMPFHKTGGIPRSYGEFGLLASAAWAYFLVFRHRYPVYLRYLLGGLLVLAAVVSQSRNVYLTMLVVSAAYYVLREVRLRYLAIPAVIFILILPVLVNFSLPVLRSIPFTRALIGEGIFETNVLGRTENREVAYSLLQSDPAGALRGFSRSDYMFHAKKLRGGEVGVHNHFLAGLLFLGVPAGAALIVLLYIRPLVLVGKRLLGEPIALAIFLAVCGALVSLGFYEGWFSAGFAVILAALWTLAFATVPVRTRSSNHYSLPAA